MSIEVARDELADFCRSRLCLTSRLDRTVLGTPFSYPTGEAMELAVERAGDEWIISDMGTTDGFLAERGVTWGTPAVTRVVEALRLEQRIELRNGVLQVRCRQHAFVSAIMAVAQGALAIAGAAYVPPPRMPTVEAARSRARVRTRFIDLVRDAGLAGDVDVKVEFVGRSQHKVTVAKARNVLIFAESLKQEPVRRAQAVAFELLDLPLDVRGAPEGEDAWADRLRRAACVYDPPTESADGKLREARQILDTYFEAGTFSITEESTIIDQVTQWLG